LLGSHLQVRAHALEVDVVDVAKQVWLQSQKMSWCGAIPAALGAFTTDGVGLGVPLQKAHMSALMETDMTVKLDEVMTRRQASEFFTIMSTHLLQMCDASCAFMVMKPPPA